MRKSSFWWVLIGFMILLDFYFFQAIKTVSQSGSSRARTIVYVSYWVISGAALITLLLLPYLQFQHQAKLFRTTIFAMIVGLFFSKLIASLFLCIDDIRRGIEWIISRVSRSGKETILPETGITRSVFLSWVGIIAGGGLFSSL